MWRRRTLSRALPAVTRISTDNFSGKSELFLARGSSYQLTDNWISIFD